MLAKRYSVRLKIIKRWLGRLTALTLAFLTCCYIYGKKIEPNWFEVVPVEIAIPNLSPVFNDFKIVQISDIHSSRFMPKKRLDRIVKLVNKQQPDAIAITGDIITHHQHYNALELEQSLSQLKAKSASLAVLGNHDHWPKKINNLKQILVNSNITNLNNQVYTIKRGTENLTFAGVDDPYWGDPDLNKVLNELPNNSPAILLVHEPDYIGKVAKLHKFDLQLSGHSHGGQIRLPFRDPLILPTGGKKYFAGLYQVEDTIAYTNRGVGMTSLPFRFNSRPEITVFTLHPATST